MMKIKSSSCEEEVLKIRLLVVILKNSKLDKPRKVE